VHPSNSFCVRDAPRLLDRAPYPEFRDLAASRILVVSAAIEGPDLGNAEFIPGQTSAHGTDIPPSREL
jgi:hypothetical protein